MVKHGQWDKYRGIISAIVTPIHDDESINEDALALLVAHQLKRGVEGFYCCGSSGEGPLLSLEERQRVLRTLVEQVNGKVPVISHVGAALLLQILQIGDYRLLSQSAVGDSDTGHYL